MLILKYFELDEPHAWITIIDTITFDVVKNSQADNGLKIHNLTYFIRNVSSIVVLVGSLKSRICSACFTKNRKTESNSITFSLECANFHRKF